MASRQIGLVMTTNDEALLSKAINHPFLSYQPYAKRDEDILADAKQRSANISYPYDIVCWLDYCCCICEIGAFKELEFDTTELVTGDLIHVTYESAVLRFPNNGSLYAGRRINKSDFSSRKYFKLMAFGNDISLQKAFCERYATTLNDFVIVYSLVNDTDNIEAAEGQQAIMAYDFIALNDYANLRHVVRLYTETYRTNFADVIREQILRTQQLALCILINCPDMYSKDLDKGIHQKYLPQLKQMYSKVSNEMRDRGVSSVLMNKYL